MAIGRMKNRAFWFRKVLVPPRGTKDQWPGWAALAAAAPAAAPPEPTPLSTLPTSEAPPIAPLSLAEVVVVVSDCSSAAQPAKAKAEVMKAERTMALVMLSVRREQNDWPQQPSVVSPVLPRQRCGLACESEKARKSPASSLDSRRARSASGARFFAQKQTHSSQTNDKQSGRSPLGDDLMEGLPELRYGIDTAIDQTESNPCGDLQLGLAGG
jgi:hypothetical protein